MTEQCRSSVPAVSGPMVAAKNAPSGGSRLWPGADRADPAIKMRAIGKRSKAPAHYPHWEDTCLKIAPSQPGHQAVEVGGAEVCSLSLSLCHRRGKKEARVMAIKVMAGA